MRNAAEQVKKHLIELAVNDKLPADFTQLSTNAIITAMEKGMKDKVILDITKDDLTGKWQLWYGQRLLHTAKTRKDLLEQII